MNELIEIQRKLKAPKNQRNTFGNYNYRNTEDILEAVKPLLAEYKCVLTLSDEVKEIGTRVYVMATASLTNSKGQTMKTTAYAREAETKKGMDDSQITGTASSYARKYALNGLFAIDDNKDADYLPSAEDIDKAVSKANNAKTVDEVTKIWNDYPQLHLNESFRKAVTVRGRELSNNKPKETKKNEPKAQQQPSLL